MSSLPVFASKRFRFEDVPNLAGRVALVLGGSAGIGYNSALALALANAKVIIASSTEEHGQEALQKIREAIAAHHPEEGAEKGSVEFEQVDLGSLADTRALAKKINDTEERLDIFIGDAGIGVAPFGLTRDGLGNHFQVNNLAQFVLINELLPLMEKTADIALPNTVRFVTLASELHRTARSDVAFASMEEVSLDQDPNRLYARSKLGAILLAKQLAKRKLQLTNKVIAMSVHPGAVATDQQDGLTEAYGPLGTLITKVVRPFMKSPDQGCESSIWAATSPEIVPYGYQGQYFTEPYGKPETETDQAKDEALGNAFWELCEKLSQQS